MTTSGTHPQRHSRSAIVCGSLAHTARAFVALLKPLSSSFHRLSRHAPPRTRRATCRARHRRRKRRTHTTSPRPSSPCAAHAAPEAASRDGAPSTSSSFIRPRARPRTPARRTLSSPPFEMTLAMSLSPRAAPSSARAPFARASRARRLSSMKMTMPRASSARDHAAPAPALASATPAMTRRASIAIAVALASASVASSARAVDLEEAQRQKEARKAALRAAADASAKSGRGESAFDDAAYGVSEESRTPNAHSRQEEGLKEALRNNV